MFETVNIHGFFDGIELRSVADSLGSPPHMHDAYTIVLLTKGNKVVQTGRRQDTATAGDVLVHEPCQVHQTQALSVHGYSFKHLEISTARLTELLDGQVPPAFPGHRKDDEIFQSLLRAYHNLATDDDIFTQDEILTWALLKLFPIENTSHLRTDIAPKLVSQIREFLHTYYMYSFTLDVLVRLTHISRVHVSRVFKQHVGLAPHQYLLQLRIARAKTMLAAGMPIVEVAMLTGFADQAHLTRHFKRITHLTPHVYAQSCYKSSRHH